MKTLLVMMAFATPFFAHAANNGSTDCYTMAMSIPGDLSQPGATSQVIPTNLTMCVTEKNVTEVPDSNLNIEQGQFTIELKDNKNQKVAQYDLSYEVDEGFAGGVEATYGATKDAVVNAMTKQERDGTVYFRMVNGDSKVGDIVGSVEIDSSYYLLILQ